MKFLLLNGPSCSGKSTVVKRVLAEQGHFYKLSYDAQKWLFSKYDRHEHFEDVEKVVLALAREVTDLGYNIICDSGLHKENREKILAIARVHDYEIIEVNLEADYDTLLRRFDERIMEARINPNAKISNTSKERFKELYDTYIAEKNPKAVTFDTGVLRPDQVYQEIVLLLNQESILNHNKK